MRSFLLNHGIAGGLDLHPTAWAANLQSHLWDCHSSAMHPAGGLTSATHQTSQQGYVVCPGTVQANHHCYTYTFLPLLQTSKALLSGLGFTSAARPLQHHLNCQVAQGSLVPSAGPQTAPVCFQQSAPEMCSHRHYTSGLIPPVLHMLAKGKIWFIHSQRLTWPHILTQSSIVTRVNLDAKAHYCKGFP